VKSGWNREAIKKTGSKFFEYTADKLVAAPTSEVILRHRFRVPVHGGRLNSKLAGHLIGSRKGSVARPSRGWSRGNGACSYYFLTSYRAGVTARNLGFEACSPANFRLGYTA